MRNTYNKLGRLETVQTYAREGAALTNPEVAKYIYDVIGNLDKIHHSNGIITDYNYDLLNRLKEVIHKHDINGTPDNDADDVVVEKFEYTYHANGHKSGEVATDEAGNQNTWNWDYDALGRLVKERHDNHKNDLDYTTGYVFDLVGNRLEKNTDKNGDGIADEQLLSEFDQNDRLLNETKVLNGVDTQKTEYDYNVTEQIKKTVTDLLNSRLESKTEMKYNDQGRMSEIRIETYVNGVLSKVVTQEYEYDSSGIKVKQTESVDENADGVADSKKVTEYLNDNQNHTGFSQVLEEKTSENGGPVKVTTYTIGHDVLAQYDAVNGFLALLTDGHGSTRAVADKLGKILQEYNYDAYGNALGFDPSEALTNLLYSGEQFNAVSGLQYLRARWYNPQSGTFNRLDPFGGNKNSPLSFHKYAYGNMNPIFNIDPTGHFSLAAIIGALEIIDKSNAYARPSTMDRINLPIPTFGWDSALITRFNSLNILIRKMEAVGNKMASAVTVSPEHATFKTNWPFLQNAISYQQKYYTDYNQWEVMEYMRKSDGFNPSFTNPWGRIQILREKLLGHPESAIITMIHEPQHDHMQAGVGHNLHERRGFIVKLTNWEDLISNTIGYMVLCASGGQGIKGLEGSDYERILRDCGL